jgi:hypothetical protein
VIFSLYSGFGFRVGIRLQVSRKSWEQPNGLGTDSSGSFLPHREDNIPIGAYVSEYKFTKSKQVFFVVD